MNIIFYYNASEKNKIGKTLIDDLTISGTLREETDIISPSILIEAESLTGYNYARIPQFNRYYFVRSMEAVRSGLWRVNLDVDVLESFKTSIKEQHVILADSADNGANDYLSGEQWSAKVKCLTDIINFPSGLNNSGEYILITVGG